LKLVRLLLELRSPQALKLLVSSNLKIKSLVTN